MTTETADMNGYGVDSATVETPEPDQQEFDISSSDPLAEFDEPSGTSDVSPETVDKLHSILNRNHPHNWIGREEIKVLLQTGAIDAEWMLQDARRRQTDTLRSTNYTDTIGYGIQSSRTDHRIEFIGKTAILSTLFAILMASMAYQGVITGGTAFVAVSLLMAYTIGAAKTWYQNR